MEGTNYVNIAMDALCAIIMVLILHNCIMDKQSDGRKTKLFIGTVRAAFFLLLFDIPAWFYIGRPENLLVLQVSTFMTYVMGYILAMYFVNYLIEYARPDSPLFMRLRIIVDFFLLASMLTLIINLFNGMYYYFDDAQYCRGPLFFLSQLFPVSVVVVGIIVLCTQKQLTVRERYAFVALSVLPLIAVAVQVFAYGLTLSYIASAISAFIIYLNIYTQRGKALAEKEVELTQARINIMLSQIQPHFLYNSLAAIQNLCHGKAPEAELAAKQFAEFLRGNLDSLASDKPISFSQELKHTQNYLLLEQLRFKDRLRVEYDIKAELFRLPALTLQPIVENAVCHGVTKREEGGTVKISSEETADAFIVTVKDDGVGFDLSAPARNDRLHLGMSNVSGRLKQMVGGTLDISSTPGVGTTSVLTIPKGDTH